MKRKEFFGLWIKALRSGKYKQGRRYLAVGNKYCCLGVACDLANTIKARKVEINEMDEVLPDNMLSLLGIDAIGKFKINVYHRGKCYSDLAEMNDGGVKFKTIARIIEEQLEAKNFRKP